MALHFNVTVMKAIFIGMGCLMVSTLIYTIFTAASPFHYHVFFPWLTTTLVDFYINIIVLATWVCYKESSWLSALLWVVLLICFGSATTCTYITIQLFKLSPEESSQDPMYHLLLRQPNKNGVGKSSSLPLLTARVAFGALGCFMVGVLVYTILNYGLPFDKDLLTPWMTATLVDFYINVAALSVWIMYKEPNWFVAFTWIVLAICLGSITTCAYVVWQFLQLSPYDPLYLVLLNTQHRKQV